MQRYQETGGEVGHRWKPWLEDLALDDEGPLAAAAFFAALAEEVGAFRHPRVG